ncbi:hypothetical protein PtA15_18A198 [Puccinia triticina]|nr:uncharacterized protein PtA15_18A198 [Puccinia triticina]WAQ93140.1 hypothetical protein PtA15_18A198 [Puccinia triticina]
MSPYFGNGYNLWGGYNSWYSRWYSIYNTNFYGYQCFNYIPGYFVKATEEAHSVNRRAIPRDVQHLSRRIAGESVACATHGKPEQIFTVKDCLSAANHLVEKKVSTATQGTCTLSLVHGTDKVAPGAITAKELEQGVHNILKACSQPANEKAAAGKENAKIDDQQAVMLLSSPQ